MLANVNRASCEGVPTSEFVNVFAAVFSEAERAGDRARHVEHEGDVEPARRREAGLLRDDCQMPPDAVAFVLPVASMKVAFAPDDA